MFLKWNNHMAELQNNYSATKKPDQKQYIWCYEILENAD